MEEWEQDSDYTYIHTYIHALCVKSKVRGQLTTVRTAPGFCTRRAFTTWNTSTTPSDLQRSIVVAMAQNMPERLTVSLTRKKETERERVREIERESERKSSIYIHTCTVVVERYAVNTHTHTIDDWSRVSPAVDDNGPVPCPTLNLLHLLNDINDSPEVGAVTIRSPVVDVELVDLVSLARLRERRESEEREGDMVI